MLRLLTYELFFNFLVEHCSTNTGGAMGSNCVEVLNFFFFCWGGGEYLQLLKLR